MGGRGKDLDVARSAPISPQRSPVPRDGQQPCPEPDDWARCRDITREHGRTFYFACQLLPPSKRRGIHAIYAWCRHADDLVDNTSGGDTDSVHVALDRWQQAITEPIDPVSRSFAWVVETYGISIEPAHDLIAGVRMDLDKPHFHSWDELRWYSYCVAGTVGLMTAPLLGCCDDEMLPRAVDLGVAMQLTNILRDVAEDASLGRVYLPDEDLDRFGVSRESLLALRPDGDFRGLMEFEIKRARDLYQQAHPGIRALSLPGQLTTLAGSHLYREILRRIEEQEYDVFHQRAAVSTRHKLAEMPVVFATFLRLQLPGSGGRLRI